MYKMVLSLGAARVDLKQLTMGVDAADPLLVPQ